MVNMYQVKTDQSHMLFMLITIQTSMELLYFSDLHQIKNCYEKESL